MEQNSTPSEKIILAMMELKEKVLEQSETYEQARGKVFQFDKYYESELYKQYRNEMRFDNVFNAVFRAIEQSIVNEAMKKRC